MVNGNDLKYVIIGHVAYISDLCFLNPDLYNVKTEWYLDLYMAYIFLNGKILQTFLKMCVFILG